MVYPRSIAFINIPPVGGITRSISVAPCFTRTRCFLSARRQLHTIAVCGEQPIILVASLFYRHYPRPRIICSVFTYTYFSAGLSYRPFLTKFPPSLLRTGRTTGGLSWEGRGLSTHPGRGFYPRKKGPAVQFRTTVPGITAGERRSPFARRPTPTDQPGSSMVTDIDTPAEERRRSKRRSYSGQQ